jgi:hypothetical protein
MMKHAETRSNNPQQQKIKLTEEPQLQQQEI